MRDSVIKLEEFKMPIVDDDLLRACYRLFSLQFCDSSDP